ncbi:DUF3050 domain-containing protein [Kistimonas scapharcae]|uniref:DUF3050 domain-containing protein n=1 Tax=Kistimonas scapharcae TaxID=1036133 RepID=A0ABP8UYJ0_9GAMM
MFDKELAHYRQRLFSHPLYERIDTREKLATFMETHVFAVWDFMSLAKRLQHDLTGMALPWRTPVDANAARFINEIILCEETDKDRHGHPASHLAMYLEAMREIGADTSVFEAFHDALHNGVPWQTAIHANGIPAHVRTFVTDTLTVAIEGSSADVASYFLFGREDAIPEMFSALLSQWGIEPASIPGMMWYLERHIELDGDEHGPAAEAILRLLTQGTEDGMARALVMARQAISARMDLWQGALDAITETRVEQADRQQED